MSKPTKFVPKKLANGKWRLNVPPKFTRSGKRERQYYKTQREALDAAAKLKEEREEFGSQARAIAPSLAEQATAAAKLLKPFGISILDAVAAWVDIQNRNLASMTIEDAVAAFRASRGEQSDTQAQAYRLRGEKLIVAFTGRMVSTIEGGELQTHLVDTTGGAGAFNQNLRLVRAMWRWWAKPPRKWCDGEAVDHLEAQKSTSGEIQTLTAAQAEALLSAAVKNQPDTVPAFAIALFTGMRQIEITRLQPEDITVDGITVPKVSAKTKRRRFIQMPEPLAAWLAAYPVGETVCPANWTRKDKFVRRMAGFKVWSDMTDPKEPGDELPAWPENALRHTAATVSVNLGKPIEQLIFEHGHTGGLEMLRRHYVGAMPKAQALAIWNLRPGTKAGKKTATNLRAV